MSAALEIPTVFPLLTVGSSVGIFVLKYVGTNSLFQFVGTDFKTAGIVKGCKSLDFRVSNRGESTLLAHDFPLESLVC